MYVLETHDLCKKYKEHLVVNNVNMHIEEGDIYGFVGENGAGKTTILRLITGLANPTSGKFTLFGVDSDSDEINIAKEKLSGIVETVSLNKSMDALDNLKLQCLITNTKKSDEELIQLIEKVGLNYQEIKTKKVGNFSLGMRQRIGIACIMISNPKFVLLDEPMNGLDPQGFIDVREVILKLKEEGVTFLISSHILSELDKICNKIGFISHGVLLDEISIEDLHAKSRRRIEIESDDPARLLGKLTIELHLNDCELENDKVIIFDEVDINDVIDVISREKLRINNFTLKQDTIEDYYINLIGRGVKHE